MPEDKHGAALSKGDLIEVYHAGELHHTKAQHFSEIHGIQHVHVVVPFTTPTAAVLRVSTGAQHKPADKPATAPRRRPGRPATRTSRKGTRS